MGIGLPGGPGGCNEAGRRLEGEGAPGTRLGRSARPTGRLRARSCEGWNRRVSAESGLPPPAISLPSAALSAPANVKGI